jgi:hypothetical protein
MMPDASVERTAPISAQERAEEGSSGGTGRGRRRRLWPFVLAVLVVVVGFGAMVADAYYQSYRIYHDAKSILPDLERARSSLSHGMLPSGDPFAAASRAASRAQERIDEARFTFRLTGALPLLGRPVKAVRLGTAAAVEEARAASIMRDVLQGALGPAAVSGGSSGQPRPALIPIFHGGSVDVRLIESFEPSLQSVISHLEAGDRYVRALPSVPFLSRLTRLKAEALADSAKAIKVANQALSAVRLLPSFLGADGPKTYYLGLENNADQRATGGDVLAYAFITIDHGRLELGRGGGIAGFKPREYFPDVKLPANLAWYVDHIRFPQARPLLSNINYTPDFPVVAQGWAAMIRKGTGIRIDGAFALDPIAVSRLLGDHVLRIPAYPQPITSANVVRVVENDQYRLPLIQQRVFPTELIAAAWPAIVDPEPFLPTIQRMGEALRQKHVLLWSADPRLQQLLTHLRWDGGLHRQPGDYLYAVDNKLRANKVDYYTFTRVAYSVTVEPNGDARARCTVTLDNRWRPGQPLGLAPRQQSAGAVNAALISLFVPADATLVRAMPPSGPPDHREDGANVFIRKIFASPGKPSSVTFEYTVPGVIQNTAAGRVYQLTVQHQPMVNPTELTVTVTLPAGTMVKSAPTWIVRGNVATFRTRLTADFVARIVF